MDPKSRFIAALALSTTALLHVGASSLQADEALTELEMYNRCKTGIRWECEKFLNAFPASRYASDVLGAASDRIAGEKGAFHPRGNLIY